MVPAPLVVLADFNETLVRERTLVRWSLDRMREGPRTRRLLMLLRVLPLGALSIAADLAGAPALAARIGLRVLQGVPLRELEEWARTRLTPNPLAHDALARMRAEPGVSGIHLVPLSRGTPGAAIRAYLARADVRTLLGAADAEVAADPLAPELEVREGVFTGRLTRDALSKADRESLIPPGAVFLGDRRDEVWVGKVKGKFRFVKV